MFSVELSKEYIVNIDGTSDGTQTKYYKDGIWYKENSVGDEATAERLASIVLQCSTLKKDEYVVYEDGLVNGKRSCRSKDFSYKGSFYSLYRAYELLTSDKLNEIILQFQTPEERAQYVIDFFNKELNVDLRNYFSKIFTLDMIILNEDRHLNNLGILRTPEGKYIPAPIFDNGKSLLVGNYSVNKYFSVEDNAKRTVARPFSGSFKKQYEMFGAGFLVDFTKGKKIIKKEPDTYEKEVLLYQLDMLKEKFPELEKKKERKEYER